ncbi:hypothetical protein G977_01957 [Escherichia coli UMEA 3585-1]|nr:hypothetical protein G977_01957 [Escherichia coli UMEA 3585-1]
MQALEQMLALRGLRHSVLLACREKSKIAQEVIKRGIDITFIPFRNSLHVPSILKLSRVIKKIKENNFIAFEISENHPNLDMDDSVIDFLFSLSGYIWLDDFGSSNATMSAVIKRPYHAIKIDKCFLQHNIENHTISETIKRIKVFVPHVIAEGIENDVYHKMSVELDLWGGQGYYFLNTNMPPHCEWFPILYLLIF